MCGVLTPELINRAVIIMKLDKMQKFVTSSFPRGGHAQNVLVADLSQLCLWAWYEINGGTGNGQTISRYFLLHFSYGDGH